MTDLTQNTPPVSSSSNAAPVNSYVDAYQPAQSSEPSAPSTMPSATPSPMASNSMPPMPSTLPEFPEVTAPVTPAASNVSANSDAPASSTTSMNADTSSEALEDQNIFDLLGVSSATDEEKEGFLDELQQVIWEDFLDTDVELLLTAEEMTGLKQIMGDKPNSDLDQQEKIITYLEKYIPDLEEVMLEKALELKEDMVRERLAGLREFFVGQADHLAQLDRAEQMMAQGQWRSAANVMNQLPT